MKTAHTSNPARITIAGTLVTTSLLLASADVDAQEDATSDVLEEVVVTAGFRDNELMTTPASVTVVDEATIENRGARHLESILNTSANINYSGGASRARFVQVRGVGDLEPWVRGGPQERRRRGGTHNVAGIVGLGVACALAEAELDERMLRYAALRDRLWDGIQAKVPEVYRNGRPPHVLPNTLNVEFRGAPGDSGCAPFGINVRSRSVQISSRSGGCPDHHRLWR